MKFITHINNFLNESDNYDEYYSCIENTLIDLSQSMYIKKLFSVAKQTKLRFDMQSKFGNKDYFNKKTFTKLIENKNYTVVYDNKNDMYYLDLPNSQSEIKNYNRILKYDGTDIILIKNNEQEQLFLYLIPFLIKFTKDVTVANSFLNKNGFFNVVSELIDEHGGFINIDYDDYHMYGDVRFRGDKNMLYIETDNNNIDILSINKKTIYDYNKLGHFITQIFYALD